MHENYLIKEDSDYIFIDYPFFSKKNKTI